MAAYLTRDPAPGIAWQRAKAPIAYEAAVRRMEERVAAILDGTSGPLLWLVEHPPLITAGTSASYDDLRQPGRFPVHETGRGGRLTYHGPGQRVAYVMLDLRTRGQDLRRYVHDLEEWLIRTVARFGVEGGRRDGRVGIWVETGPGGEAKIAAIGVRVRRWITFHGVALNVNPALDHFEAIVPCGISEHGVTSLAALGVDATMAAVDDALLRTFGEVFGAAPSPEPALDPI